LINNKTTLFLIRFNFTWWKSSIWLVALLLCCFCCWRM